MTQPGCSFSRLCFHLHKIQSFSQYPIPHLIPGLGKNRAKNERDDRIWAISSVVSTDHISVTVDDQEEKAELQVLVTELVWPWAIA